MKFVNLLEAWQTELTPLDLDHYFENEHYIESVSLWQ